MKNWDYHGTRLVQDRKREMSRIEASKPIESAEQGAMP